jgi:hypothetical protein
MDDQNVGVRSQTEAREVVNCMARSLASQRLTLNSGKTKFLDPPAVKVHFQLDANAKLNQWDEDFKNSKYKVTDEVRDSFDELWNSLRRGKSAEVGNWDKVLKRLYAIAIRVDSPSLEALTLDHLIAYPDLAERIFHYYAKRNRGLTLFNFFEQYRGIGENLFEATEVQFFEAALLLPDLESATRDAYLRLAREMALREAAGQTGRPLGMAAALIALYWFGEQADTIAGLYSDGSGRRLPKEVARAWLAVLTALDATGTGDALGSLVGHPADDVARLATFLNELLRGRIDTLGSYKHLKPRWPLPGKYYDARAWLVYEIGSQGNNPKLLQSLRKDVPAFRKVARTASEKRILSGVEGRLAK